MNKKMNRLFFLEADVKHSWLLLAASFPFVIFGLFMMFSHLRFLGGFLMSIGLLLVIGSVTVFKHYKQRQQVIAELKTKGTRLVADVFDYETRKTSKEQGEGDRSGYYLHCSYVTAEGQVYVFKSDRIDTNPMLFSEGAKVHVYCDKEGMAPYFVDVDTALIGVKGEIING